MNRKEAIRKLEYSKKAYQRLIDEKVDSGKLIGKDVRGEWKADTPLDEAYKSMIDALEMAIKALKQEPCEDAISRQAVLDMMQMRMSGKELYKAVYDLPPVNPQPCGDLISRKAILEEFENDQYHLEFCKEHHIERSISMEMVRIRLHDLPPVNPQLCENAISRQTVLDIVDSYSESQSNVEDVTQDIISDIVVLPPVNLQSTGDLISRQSAIFLANDLKQDLPDDAHLADMVMAHNEGVSEYQTQLSLLPPVTPQPKTGHWIDIDGGVECDKCGKWYPHAPIAKNEIKFCSECGAKMSEPQERNEKE